MKVSEVWIVVTPKNITDEELAGIIRRQEQLSEALWAPVFQNIETLQKQRVGCLTHWFSYN